MAEAAGASKGDAVLIIAGKPKVVMVSLGALWNAGPLIVNGFLDPRWVVEMEADAILP